MKYFRCLLIVIALTNFCSGVEAGFFKNQSDRCKQSLVQIRDFTRKKVARLISLLHQEGPAGSSNSYPKKRDFYRARNHGIKEPKNANSIGIAQINKPGVKFFSLDFFDQINPHAGSLEISFPLLKFRYQPLQPSDEQGEYSVDYFFSGHKNVLVLPDDYEPIQPKNAPFKISVEGHGNYNIETSEKFLSIPVKRTQPKIETQEDLKKYTQIVDIPFEAWPDWLKPELKALIERKKAQNLSNIEVAHELMNILDKEIQYENKRTARKGVFEFLNDKRYKCDGAACVGASLLRSVFHIPTKAIMGFKGQPDLFDNQKSVALLGREHALNKVYDEQANRWVTCDFTPSKRNVGSQSGGSDSAPSPTPKPSPSPAPPFPHGTQKLENNVPRLIAEALVLDITNDLLRGKQNPNALARANQFLQTHQNDLGLGALEPSRALESINQFGVSSGWNLTEASERKQLMAVLNLTEKLRPLNTREACLKNLLTKIIADELKLNERIQEKFESQFKDEVFSQLPGPISKKYVNDILWPLVLAQRESEAPQSIFKMIQLAFLSPYLDLWTQSNQREISKLKLGAPTKSYPTDGDMEVDNAGDELPDFAYIYRDGLPQLDVLRFLAGDLLVTKFPDLDHISLASGVPHSITIVAFDTTASMENGGKREFADLLIRGVIDKSQVLAAQGIATHEVDLISFTEHLDGLQKIKSLNESGEVFQNFNFPPTRNSVSSAAFPEALNFARDLSLKSKNTRNINLLFITDGQDPINIPELVKLYDQIPENIDINISVISLGDRNESLEAFIDQLARNRKSHGLAFRHYLSMADLQAIDGKARKKFAEIHAKASEAALLVQQIETPLLNILHAQNIYQELQSLNGNRWKIESSSSAPKESDTIFLSFINFSKSFGVLSLSEKEAFLGAYITRLKSFSPFSELGDTILVSPELKAQIDSWLQK